MTSPDYGSLLALDTYSSEELIRVAIYSRAYDLSVRASGRLDPDVVASEFVEFVKNERHRLDALDAVLKHAARSSTVDTIIAKAKKIVKWAESSAKPVAAMKPQTPAATKPQPEVKKKVFKKRR